MNGRTRSRSVRQAKSPSGVVLIGVIVGLAIASAIWFALIKTAVAERNVVRRQQGSWQARELASSALERAAARLSADRQYTGETWQIPAADLDGRHAAAVKIEIVGQDERPQRFKIRVQARYPETEEHFATEALETYIDLSPERNGS